MRSAAERQAYIRERMRDSHRQERLWIRDDWRDLSVFDVPIDGLLLNVDNRRFRVERMWAEERLGRPLDPENIPNDVRSVESLLLDASHRVEGGVIVGAADDASESLRTDWLRRRQETSLWIRPDGTVRNGNRRLAMVLRMQRTSGDTGLQWIACVILDPADVDESALLEMEQREQLTENFKVRYNDIDYLLALKEAAELREIDWFDRASLDRIAGELQTMAEKSRAEVLRDLFAIKYMDLFLEDSNQSGQYHHVLRTLERFRDIGRTMMRVESEYPAKADEVLRVLFAAIKSGIPHQGIRTLRSMFRFDADRFDSLHDAVADVEDASEAGIGEAVLATPETVAPVEDPEGDDEDTEDLRVSLEVTNYPADAVAGVVREAIDAFESSREDDTAKILREITARMQILSEAGRLRQAIDSADDPGEFKVELATMAEWIDSHRDLI